MLKKALQFIKKWLWEVPISTEKKEEGRPAITPEARKVIDLMEVIEFEGKGYQLKKTDVHLFNKLPRKHKLRLIDEFQSKVRKGMLVRFDLDGKVFYSVGRGFDHQKLFKK